MKSKVAIKIWMPLFTAVTLLSACSSIPDREERLQAARNSAPADYREITIRTSNFDLLSFVPANADKIDTLTILIEGDGAAWFNKATPSQDPTPIRQMVPSQLRHQSHQNAVYLARPCQFVGPTNGACTTRYWTNARYSEEAVSAMNQAVTQLKETFRASKVLLVGHSGGGTIATLLAARRADIAGLITMAAPLDLDAFTSHHNTTRMTASLNPVDYAVKLSDTPQIHVFGRHDETVPAHLANLFINSLLTTDCVQTEIVATDHFTGWSNLTPHPLNRTPICRTNAQ